MILSSPIRARSRISPRENVDAPDEYAPENATGRQVRGFDFVLVYAIPEDPDTRWRLGKLAPILSPLELLEARGHWRLYRSR